MALSTFVSATDKIYRIELSGDSGDVVADVSIGEGFISNLPGDYRYFLISQDNEVLDTFTFGLEEGFDYHTHSPTNDPEVVITDHHSMAIESNLVSAAYFRDGALIRLSAPDGATLAEIDVLRFANVCGDNICQDQENYGSCSEDCPAGTADGYCVELQDNVCDPDCDSSVDADCFIEKVEMSSQEGRDDRNNLITYAIILVSVAVIAAVGLLIYKHARRDSYVY